MRLSSIAGEGLAFRLAATSLPSSRMIPTSPTPPAVWPPRRKPCSPRHRGRRQGHPHRPQHRRRNLSRRRDTGSALLANADAALYHVKTDGRGAVHVYESKSDKAIRERWALQADLGHALRKRELTLHYQPQADNRRQDLRLRGAAALDASDARLDLAIGVHSARRRVQSHSGRVGLGARGSLPHRRRLGAAAHHRRQPVTDQFQHGELPRLIQQTLLDTGLAPSRLELEITEGILLGDFAHIVGMLRRIKAMGVRVAMDDFGTGYSSLSYLHAFPFDKIKIDKSFVQAIGRSEQASTIIRAVIGLCRGHGIPVIAEGVETEEQRPSSRRNSARKFRAT